MVNISSIFVLLEEKEKLSKSFKNEIFLHINLYIYFEVINVDMYYNILNE